MEEEDTQKVFEGFALLPRMKQRTHPVVEVLWVLASFFVAVVSMVCALILMAIVTVEMDWYRPVSTPLFQSPEFRAHRGIDEADLVIELFLFFSPPLSSAIITGMRLKWWKAAILGMILGVVLTLITVVIGEIFRTELWLDPIFPICFVAGLTGGLMSELRMD